MSESGSARVYEIWREAAEKFDYFAAGVAAALVGYLAPKLAPQPLGCNSTTVSLAALLAFVAAFFFATRRIEFANTIVKCGIKRLECLEELAEGRLARQSGAPFRRSESGTALTPEEIEGWIKERESLVAKIRCEEVELSQKADRSYNFRNWTLIAGFVLLLAAQVWKAYE